MPTTGDDGRSAYAGADPFDVLVRANNVVLSNLRRDLAIPELHKQLTQTGLANSAQAYFCDPYTNSYLGPQIRPKSFAMLPAPLARERDRVECMSFMGLLPEIDHAWMTVDNVLFLWNYHTQDFTQYRQLEQVIVTVALVPPKRGVFQQSVKHVLAVATTVEVVLLAVTYQGEPAKTSTRNRRIQVRLTNFRAYTDGVSMLKIAAHPNGRVFMAGKDGNMYELTYTVSYGFMYSVFFVGDSTGSRKCKRVMHRSSGAPPSPVHALLALLGIRSAQRTLVDVVVDPLRNVLYTLDLEGNMDLFDLGADGNHTTQKMSRFNIWEAAYKFCRWAGHSNLAPDQSIFKEPHKFQVVSLGVVDPTESKLVSLVAVTNAGMRFYLSCGYSGGTRHNFQLNIVQIRNPPPEALWKYLQESSKAQQGLPLTLEAGGIPSGSGGAPPTARGGGVAVVGGGVAAAGGRQPLVQPPDGFSAKWERQASTTPSVYQAYCCHGVTVLAQTLVGQSGECNRLILVGPDLVTRSKRRREAHQEEHPWMREAVTSEEGGDAGTLVPGVRGVEGERQMGKVWAVSERPVSLMSDIHPNGALLRTFLVTSRTPSHTESNGGGGAGRAAGGSGALRESGRGAPIARTGNGSSTSTALAVRSSSSKINSTSAGIVQRAMQWRQSDSYPERPVAPAPPLVCSPGGSGGCPGGLLPKDVGRIVALPELATQFYSERRELLCLTSSGLQTFAKLRPVDLLFDLLAQNQMEKVSLFFDDFSPDQSAAMCFSIACGLPKDLGCLADEVGGAPPLGIASTHTVRSRALDAALKNCMPPAFSSPQAASGGGGVGDGVGGGMGVGGAGVIFQPKFNNSALHNGLQLFIARLLRPFWSLPVVVIKEDKGVSGSKRSADGRPKGSDGETGVPSIVDLGALRAPLELLRINIRDAFPRAVVEDLAARDAKDKRDAAAIAAQAAERRAANPRQQALLGNGGAVQWRETPQQRHQTALKMEALEVHAAYRLVTRTAEAVRMVGALARVAKEFPKAKVPWSMVSGVPLWKLVTGGDEHKKASSLLADLVGPKVDLPPDFRDRLARELGVSCGTFFSQSDVRTFEGVELLRRARAAMTAGTAGDGAGGGGSGERGSVAAAAAAREGSALLIEAAKEWKGEKALGQDGQLARACAALSDVGLLVAVVDVCMTCASNFDDHDDFGRGGKLPGGAAATGLVGGSGAGVFSPNGVQNNNNNSNALAIVHGGNTLGRSAAGSLSAGSGGVQKWEEGVYQGGGITGAQERDNATLECYKRVLDTVLEVMQPPAPSPAANGIDDSSGGNRRGSRKAVDGLIARCLSYDAPRLHAMLFELLENHDKSLLIRIKTPGVERYLGKDPELLFRHFMLHKEYPKAVYLMEREARVDRGGGMHVTDRVDCLVKAISACHKCDLDSTQMVVPGWTLNHAKRQALEDELDVLLTQERLLRDLKESMVPLERLKTEKRGTHLLDGELAERARVVAEWTTGTADPTELCKNAMDFFLWKGCLQVLQCCDRDEPALARKLIRSIIWREVPALSRADSSSPTQAFITGARSRKWDIEVDDVRQQLNNAPLQGGSTAGPEAFEDDGWFGPLLDKMSGIARELLSRRESYVLPVDTLCLELQQISDAYHEAGGTASSLCVVEALERAGVSKMALLDAYESMNRTHYPREQGTKLRWLEVMTRLLVWTCQGDELGLLVESVRPERVERLAQDTITGLDALHVSAILDPEAQHRIDKLRRQLEALLHSIRPGAAYR